jgi:O-acetyl-ADP-ribose deacetylase (regulator of RNase III)
VVHPDGIQWTHKSVVRMAEGDDPVAAIERKARELVLRARDAGWQGPPFSPIAIADLLRIPVEANADIADASTIPTAAGVKIQFNPTQPRERVRFSIAHEIAHTLFPDVAEEVRHRGGSARVDDDWQLEMLCNIAAAEFIMPIGSLATRDRLAPIEQLMIERRKFDVSAEAFLIRAAKTTNEPVLMFCASPISDEAGLKSYRIDYTVPSKSVPEFRILGRAVPKGSAIYSCTAIGYSERKTENWFSHNGLTIECVGIPGYPGSRYPRVGGLIRFDVREAIEEGVKFVHGDVLDPRGAEQKIVCQLVNDQARVWGGGVAKSSARKFPNAQKEFSDWIIKIPRSQRLGAVHFAEAGNSLVIASLIGQVGFGPSSLPRIRYTALERCFEQVRDFAAERSASVHMPRIGAGQSGGSWETVEELIWDTFAANSIPVTVYDLPPKRTTGTAGLFD